MGVGWGFGLGFGLGVRFGFGAFFRSVRLPRCHLPLMPVTYPSGLTCSAMVITWGGSVLGPYPQSSPFLHSPKLFWFLPLSKPAREGEHCGAVAYPLDKMAPFLLSSPRNGVTTFLSMAPGQGQA